MRAWQLREGFGLDHLSLIEVPAEPLGPGQVRLRVKAVSLNYRDLLMVQGLYDPRQSLPLTPCSDACLEVIEVGPGVARWSVGDRVLPAFAQAWLDGRPARSMIRSTLGGPLQGTLREEVVLSQDGLVAAPAHLSDAACATLPCAGVTAWRALAVEAGVGPGDTVLTLGTGGVSLFALQIGQMLGANVLVTSGSDDKRAKAEAMGAFATRNYRDDPDWGRWAREASGGEGVDCVVELGGAGTLDQSLRAVRPGGTIALIGVLDGVRTDLAVTRILMQGIRVQGVLVGSRADLADLCRALAAHPEVQPVVDHTVPFERADEAFSDLAAQGHMGKIVVTR